MKRILAVSFLLLALGLWSKAQVVIINDNLFTGRLSEVKVAVLDSVSREPVSFASVYVIPSKDTTISNFTLTDTSGTAILDEVPYGEYSFHIEMMGYVPVVKKSYFREWRVDMGTILLRPDEKFLQAAVVTDVGNPIVVKQDTVEFNASSFRVGANAMLRDLIRRMPGMEITDDGKVKFNGETIDKLTVGGRTFFFDDQSMALNNLPASVVDKVRVIDRESESARASGVQDGSREKVLDVALKKEYEEGWFGNAGVKGGTTFSSSGEDEPLRDDRGLLFNANALISAYNKKDQLTLIGSTQNVSDDSNLVFVRYRGGEESDPSSFDMGLSSAAQAGLNLNTSRIKDVESTLSASYRYTDTDTGSETYRTTFQEDGDIFTSASRSGKSFIDSFTSNVEMKKEQGKVWFHFRPSFRYNRTDRLTSGASAAEREGIRINSSENSSRSLDVNRDADFSSDVTIRELWGNKKRSLRLGLNGSYGDGEGNSTEESVLHTAGQTEGRSMRYDSGSGSYQLGGSVMFTEPFGEKWTVSTTATLDFSHRNSIRDAFDASGRNDYYSSESDSRSINQQYGLSAQYTFGQGSWFSFGAQMSGVLTETYSKSFGISQTTGEDEWNWFLTPTMRFQHMKGDDRIFLSASGYTQRPSSSRMLPVLNITDPSSLVVGNVYLRPFSLTYLSANWNRNNKKKFSNLMVYLFGQVTSNPITYARWYDPDGILYTVPVNARKPSLNSSLYASYTTPLDEKKVWSLTLSANTSYVATTSYQTKSVISGLDKDTFDYSSFMSGFWGDESGGRFFSGESGFSESNTAFVSPTLSFRIKYNRESLSMGAGANTTGNISRYSLDPDFNRNTLDTRLTYDVTYTSKKEFELSSDISYVFYRGYPVGYGQSEWQWNASASKNVGAFNLSLTVHDILDQTRNLTHSVTGNYIEDSYRLVMGRYILFGIKWNFGKMNAAHSRRAQDAAWNMVW
ncbi:MAG: outer membrane beta-barrel protein [Bacteroidales bacterium]|nr:outer membrane beta-barrel protein [Bacteroidales bacterium]